MAYPSLTFANLLSNATRAELEQFISLLQGYLSAEHDENGAHTAITGDSVTVTGNVVSEGDGTFDGTVTADADGTPVKIGAIGPTSEPAIQLTNGTASDWMLYAKSSRTLHVRDVLEVGDTAMLDIVRTGSSAYDVRPHSSAITLTLGTDASGQRWSEVNPLLVNTRAVKFPGTQVASGDANTLDDYEEGSWTPIDVSGATLVFTSASGTYTKIGDRVFFECQVIYPVTADASSAAIGGLPFTVGAVNGSAYQGFGGSNLVFLVTAASTTVTPFDHATGAGVTNATLSGANLVISGFYKV